ncbi:MAG: HAD-IA family hydrolase, partial [Caulobacteraceae bacterium]|nr:HAD-IA family hydrolase [Caulobacteraceae bacterium]
EAASLGHAVRGAEIMTAISGDIRPGVVAALRACKARFKVGCITNNMTGAGDGPGMASSREKMLAVAEVLALFDAVIESSKVGLRKPDPKIYLMMCDLLAVKPEACVYLDDLGINCKPAAQLGMKAIKVVSEAQALADLSAAVGLEF